MITNVLPHILMNHSVDFHLQLSTRSLFACEVCNYCKLWLLLKLLALLRGHRRRVRSTVRPWLCCGRLVSWTTSSIRCGRPGPSWCTPTVGTSLLTSRRTEIGTARGLSSSSRTTCHWRRVWARTSSENRSTKSLTRTLSKRTSCEQTYDYVREDSAYLWQRIATVGIYRNLNQDPSGQNYMCMVKHLSSR